MIIKHGNYKKSDWNSLALLTYSFFLHLSLLVLLLNLTEPHPFLLHSALPAKQPMILANNILPVAVRTAISSAAPFHDAFDMEKMIAARFEKSKRVGADATLMASVELFKSFLPLS